jgi:5-formyltetrahydrofolate cyclo-ligase
VPKERVMPMLDAKSNLRAQLRLRRRELGLIHADAAERAAERLPLEDLPPFTVASGYHPLGGEIDPWPVLRRLRAAGAAIALPVATGPHAPLFFRSWREGDLLEMDAAKVPAPAAPAPVLVPDLVIAPLLGFDRAGYRLGQGGGHYDRTLEGLRRQGAVWVIGLAYAGQEVDAVPRDAHDEPLDAILTETGYHVARK